MRTNPALQLGPRCKLNPETQSKEYTFLLTGERERANVSMSLPASGACPANSFRYNGTLCACNPGLFLSVAGDCVSFDGGGEGSEWVVRSGVGPSTTFLTTVLPLDSIKRITQSQALVLGATLVALLAWLAFCAALRFCPVAGGRSVWFRIRWWISRLDFFYDTDHWLADQKAVMKRKTELGGTFSVASWILFVGLLSALLYQIITKRSIEVHRVRPASAPDLQSFVNDMEFNITTISNMSCSHLRGLNSLVIGTPGFIDYRLLPLSTYANYYCTNTSQGPSISLKCNSCRIPRRDYYISWQFVDLPNDPAMAVGFQFNLTSKSLDDDKHVNFVGGTLQSESFTNDKPKTLRGPNLNLLTIHLFPQTYSYLRNLKLVQPLIHDFIPGSSFSEASDLQASLQSSKNGLVNITLYIRYLSDYIMEIDHENVFGPVSFLADVGGLYAISLAIFLYLLVQCETRIKKLRSEDSVMRSVRCQRRSQRNWDKLRRYVMYTWGSSNLDVKSFSSRRHGGSMSGSCCGIGSLHEIRQPSLEHSISSIFGSAEMDVVPDTSCAKEPNSSLKGGTTTFDGISSQPESKHEMIDIEEEREKQHIVHCEGNTSQHQMDLCNGNGSS